MLLLLWCKNTSPCLLCPANQGSGAKISAKGEKKKLLNFGNRAVLSERISDLDPWALRPRLSNGFASIGEMPMY